MSETINLQQHWSCLPCQVLRRRLMWLDLQRSIERAKKTCWRRLHVATVNCDNHTGALSHDRRECVHDLQIGGEDRGHINA